MSVHKIWTENFTDLFRSCDLIPNNNMNTVEKINSLTRLVILLALVFHLFNFKYSIHFLIICLVFLIVLYYKRRMFSQIVEKFCLQPPSNSYGYGYKSNQQSNFQPLNTANLTLKKIDRFNNTEQTELRLPEEKLFCNDKIVVENNKQVFGVNARLSTQNPSSVNFEQATVTENPKVKIAPIVVPKAMDLDYWRDNDLIVHSAINSEGIQQDMYLSGYAESTCCGYEPKNCIAKANMTEGFCYGRLGDMPNTRQKGSIVSPTPTYDKPVIAEVPVYESKEGYNNCYNKLRDMPNQPCPQGIVSPTPTYDRPLIPVIENYQQPSENRTGWVNTTCGYDPEQLDVGLMSNLPVGNCAKLPELKQYNKNLMTQTVTPGVYTRTQVNEPVNSNIGISFQQQFEPVSIKETENGLVYTQHDPRVYTPPEPEIPPQQPNYYNTFDPRFYGYGTSYRSYIDDTTGQPRFMYDDINAIRMPNYVVRSKIDFVPYADEYGPIKEDWENGNVNNSKIKDLVQQTWVNDTESFRNDLSERRMRKINAVAWQKRVAPLGPHMV